MNRIVYLKGYLEKQAIVRGERTVALLKLLKDKELHEPSRNLAGTFMNLMMDTVKTSGKDRKALAIQHKRVLKSHMPLGFDDAGIWAKQQQWASPGTALSRTPLSASFLEVLKSSRDALKSKLPDAERVLKLKPVMADLGTSKEIPVNMPILKGSEKILNLRNIVKRLMANDIYYR